MGTFLCAPSIRSLNTKQIATSRGYDASGTSRPVVFAAWSYLWDIRLLRNKGWKKANSGKLG
eukprot:6228363-Amphidinium_carterae.1